MSYSQVPETTGLSFHIKEDVSTYPNNKHDVARRSGSSFSDGFKEEEDECLRVIVSEPERDDLRCYLTLH
ncbi:hypothetical protein J6590_095265 [Homalodisca vitripennis]|nr:hypothetical protein J6590_013714 [Homalodisca vitripennis]KAG8334229.1 hypothetical protein J6590_095265 [Homalodisca vitripennis]